MSKLSNQQTMETNNSSPDQFTQPGKMVSGERTAEAQYAVNRIHFLIDANHEWQAIDILNEFAAQQVQSATAPLEQRIKQAKWDMMNVIEDKTDLHDAIRVNGVDGVYIHEKYIHALFETLLPTPPGERNGK